VFETCAVRRSLRPTAKLVLDTGRGLQCRVIGLIPSKDVIIHK
jgi:hypothetical protein